MPHDDQKGSRLSLLLFYFLAFIAVGVAQAAQQFY